jgi:hypothetical protein
MRVVVVVVAAVVVLVGAVVVVVAAVVFCGLSHELRPSWNDVPRLRNRLHGLCTCVELSAQRTYSLRTQKSMYHFHHPRQISVCRASRCIVTQAPRFLTRPRASRVRVGNSMRLVCTGVSCF